MSATSRARVRHRSRDLAGPDQIFDDELVAVGPRVLEVRHPVYACGVRDLPRVLGQRANEAQDARGEHFPSLGRMTNRTLSFLV